MIEILRNILFNVLKALYQPFGFAIVLAVLFMFLLLYAKEKGWKTVLKIWWESFRTSTTFRKNFFLTFYTATLLFRTLLNREVWMNPLSDVIGTWGLYDKLGNLTTEAVENLMLFIPFILLLLWANATKIIGEKLTVLKVLCKSAQISFLFSLAIELTQLILRVGTFQLSDLFYNTLGGIIGGLIYVGVYKLVHRKKHTDKTENK